MVKLHFHHSQDSPSSTVGESPDQPLTPLCPLRPLRSFLIPTHGRSISKDSQTTPGSPHPWIYNKHSEFQTLTFKNIFLHLNISVCWVCFSRTFAGFLMESKVTLGLMLALWALEQKIINFHSVKIRKKEERRKGEKRRKRESHDYLAQALIQLHYWYLLSTYCMHRKITLINFTVTPDKLTSCVALAHMAFLCEWSSFTLSASWRCCENWQVCVCKVCEILRWMCYVNTKVCSLSRPQPASRTSLISQVFLFGRCLPGAISSRDSWCAFY